MRNDTLLPVHRYLAVRLSEDMPVGATISWRVDEQSVHYQYMPELRSTHFLAIRDLSPEILKPAKRVRLQWTTSTGKILFYEFDVAGAAKAMSQIPCGKRSPRDAR